MLKKLAAILLSAVISVSALSAVVSAQEMQTASVSREAEASYYKWNGKTTMQSGKNYIITSDTTISKKVTIPSGTTLVVQKGAKLWISSGGKLYIKGKLNVKSGATLAVSGMLYQYKGKVLTNYGEMRFGSKSTATLNGKVYVYSGGSVTGTPKAVSVGANAVLSCTGTNNCAKLDKYFDKTAIEKKLEAAFAYAVKENDIYATVTQLLCEEYIADIDELFKASGSSLKAFCEEFGGEFKLLMGDEDIEPAKVKSVDVQITKITENKTPEDDLKTVADTYYKNGTVYDIECTVTIKTSSDTYTEDTGMTVAEKNGEWYLLGE